MTYDCPAVWVFTRSLDLVWRRIARGDVQSLPSTNMTAGDVLVDCFLEWDVDVAGLACHVAYHQGASIF
jgi:hypothetical protein